MSHVTLKCGSASPTPGADIEKLFDESPVSRVSTVNTNASGLLLMKFSRRDFSFADSAAVEAIADSLLLDEVLVDDADVELVAEEDVEGSVDECGVSEVGCCAPRGTVASGYCGGFC